MRIRGAILRTEVFSSGDVVVLGFCDDDYVFGFIKCVIACRGKIYSTSTILIAEYFDSLLNSYKVHEADLIILHIIDQLLVYHPLRLYQISQNNFACLRHIISIAVTDE